MCVCVCAYKYVYVALLHNTYAIINHDPTPNYIYAQLRVPTFIYHKPSHEYKIQNSPIGTHYICNHF